MPLLHLEGVDIVRAQQAQEQHAQDRTREGEDEEETVPRRTHSRRRGRLSTKIADHNCEIRRRQLSQGDLVNHAAKVQNVLGCGAVIMI